MWGSIFQSLRQPPFIPTRRASAADKAGGRKFRTVLIGCGWWGNNILREAMASGACEVVALCDVDSRQYEATLKNMAAGTGDTPKLFKDYRECLAQAKPDIPAADWCRVRLASGLTVFLPITEMTEVDR